MTVREVVQSVYDELCGIRVPGALLDEIGAPLARSLNGLKSCIDAFEKADEEAAEETEGKADV